MTGEEISSLQNPMIKNLVRLQQKSAARVEQGLFVIEGRREVYLAIHAGVKPRQIFLCREFYQNDNHYTLDFERINAKKSLVSPEVYNKIAYRANAEGVIMLTETYSCTLDNIRLKKNPLLLVLESVEKPGNLGAILRTADAAGVDAVIVCDKKTDMFNPNVVRSSLGCLFTNQVAVCSNEEALLWLRKHNIGIAIASLQANSYYHNENLSVPVAMVFGTEAEGLSEFWNKSADIKIKIPMLGVIDSMNVAASVAILAYEAQRQRNFPGLNR